MTNRFMISVAAVALIAGTSFANAQGMGGREGGGAGGGAPAAQSAPSSQGGASSDRGSTSSTPMNREGASESKGAADKGGMKSTQSDEKMAPGAKNQRAQDEKAGQKGKTAQDNDKGASKDMKAEGREGRDNNMKAEGREGRDGNKNAETKNGSERTQTTGQAGAGGKLSTEQRTKISTVIKNQHVSSVTNVNFNVSVGTRVPHDVSFRPLPSEVVTIYPEWRGYNFILVREQIVIIDPRTFEIVAVIDA